MFDFENKKVLITGSTKGIGLALAKMFASHGAKVYINGCGNVEKVSSEIPGSVSAPCDLRGEDAADKLYTMTGDVDVLILNASIQYRKPWDEITSKEFDDQIKVNFKSSLELIQKYVPYMKRQGWGRILTIGSVQQYKPHKDMLVYAASKCAQMSMVENLAKQLAPYGITVNNLSPGVIQTPRNTDALSNEEYKRAVLQGIPCGYLGEAQDCVAGALLLSSEEGRYINGIDLVIDGGMKL